MENSKFEKVLSKKDIFTMAFGAMIGWSWVVMAGTWITGAGAVGAMIAFLFGGLMVVLVGLTYAELTSAMPQCGGEHTFSLRGLGKNASFVCTWAIVIGYVSVVAFEACAFPTVIQYIFPGFLKGYLYTVAGFDIYASWLAVAVIGAILITVVNYYGIKTAARVQNFFTFIICAVGIALIAASVVNGSPSNMNPLFSNGSSGVLKVILMTPFLFVGFDVIPQAAEEINVPFKKIGKIMILSIAMAVVFYMLIVMAVSSVMNGSAMASSTLVTADAMKLAFGNSTAAANILILGGMCGIVTSWNAFFIGGSRAMYSMAESAMLPKVLGKLHPKHNTPYFAILFIGALSVIAPFFGRTMMVWLTDAGSFAVVIAYFLVSCSFLALRKKAPDMPRPYKIPHGMLVGSLAVLISGFMLVLYVLPFFSSSLVFQEWIMVGICTVIGAVFYIYSRVKYGDEFGIDRDVAYTDVDDTKAVNAAASA